MFANSKLLNNIQDKYLEADMPLSSWSTHCDQQGTLPGFGDICIHGEGLTNILSFALIWDMGYCITYDVENDIFTIHPPRN